MQFDDHGNLYPYHILPTTLAQIEQHLCVTLPRLALFREYTRYVLSLQNVVQADFEQYIGGSFINVQAEPADIDVANLIMLSAPDDGQIERLLPFLTVGGSRETHRVDGHLIPVYAPGDERHANTLARIEYFRKWFGQDRVGRPRGILSLTHSAYGIAT